VARIINLEVKDASKDRAIASLKAEHAKEIAKLKQDNASMKARLNNIEKMLNSNKDK
jgi:uncharacterized coiled-coil protein SlyX